MHIFAPLYRLFYCLFSMAYDIFCSRFRIALGPVQGRNKGESISHISESRNIILLIFILFSDMQNAHNQ